jgi:uncharacterized repeat protein (TIGR01451 family)
LIVSGGSVTGGVNPGDYGVFVDGGTATISGGTFDAAVDGYGFGLFGGTATISGGSFPGDVLVDKGLANISGGVFSGDFFVSGAANISNGIFTVGVVADGGSVSISGGSISGSTVGVSNNGGTMTITGGSISADVIAFGGTLTLFGCNLRLAGTNLSGILQDGTVISTYGAAVAPGQLILDTDATQVTCPADQTVTATSAAGAVVNYLPPVVSNTCGSPVTVTCTPASGSTFPAGTTTVTCTVTNLLGNVSSCRFTVTVVRSADLGVFIGAASGKNAGNPLKVNARQSLTYTIVVINGGSVAAENVVAKDLLPDSFVCQEATTTQGSLLAPPPGTTGLLTANLGTLASGASATVHVTGYFRVRKSTIPNTATVSTTSTDSNQANNQATTNVIVN